MGFAFHPHSYLRDVWCMLDFIVVSLAWVPVFLPSFAQYSFIRVVRALRPLRTLRFLPGMPVLIGSIFKAIPQLGSVAGLCSFIFLIFGIVGEELFEGALHYRCADPTAPHRALLADGAGAELFAAGDELFGGGGFGDIGYEAVSFHRALKGGGSGSSSGGLRFCNPSDPHACDAGSACLYFGANPSGAKVDFDSVRAQPITSTCCHWMLRCLPDPGCACACALGFERVHGHRASHHV